MANIHSTKYGKYYNAIKKYYNEGKSYKEIINLLNAPEINSPGQISKILSSLGVTTHKEDNKWKNFVEIDTKALEMIKSGISCTKTAKILGIDQQSMNKRLKQHYGLKVLLDGKKNVDSNYFDNIDAEDKAYWLGFMFADGYVSDDDSIELCVKSADRSHLEKFKSDIKSEHKIGSKIIYLDGKQYRANRISFTDHHLAQALRKLGCINFKSLIIEFPDLQSLELYRHFVRGFFDGDGSILNHKSTYIQCEITCGSCNFIRSLQDYLEELVLIKTFIKKDNRSNAYKLVTGSRYEAFRMAEYLYKDSSIYLSRKYAQYKNVCRSENFLQVSLNDEDGIKRGWRKVS